MLHTLKDYPIDFNTTGDKTVVAGVPGQVIKVANFHFIVGGTVNPRWKALGGAGKGNLTGAYPLTAQCGLAPAAQPAAYLFKTGIGDALILNLDSAVQVSGSVAVWFEQTVNP